MIRDAQLELVRAVRREMKSDPSLPSSEGARARRTTVAMRTTPITLKARRPYETPTPTREAARDDDDDDSADETSSEIELDDYAISPAMRDALGRVEGLIADGVARELERQMDDTLECLGEQTRKAEALSRELKSRGVVVPDVLLKRGCAIDLDDDDDDDDGWDDETLRARTGCGQMPRFAGADLLGYSWRRRRLARGR